MAMKGQDRIMDEGQGPYPERPGKPDCSYYMCTGCCGFGMTCRYNHPPDRKQVAAAARGKGSYRETLVQPECQGKECVSYMRSGSLIHAFRDRPTGKFNHPHLPLPLQRHPSTGCVDPLPEGMVKLQIWNAYQISEINSRGVLERMDFYKKVMDWSEPKTQSYVSDFFTAEIVSCGIDDQDSSDISISSQKYISAHDVDESIEFSATDPNIEVVRRIEGSRVHWSELSSDRDSDADGESNREIFERLRLMPKYKDWLDLGVGFPVYELGQKLAVGGQAEIYEVRFCDRFGKSKHNLRFVLKVFKEGYSLRDLQTQWPEGILSSSISYHMSPVRGGMVLEDDRFGFLLFRKDLDLRQLIDVAQEENSPLWGEKRRPLEEFRTYEPRIPTRGSSKPVFSVPCALQIMYAIAGQMFSLHSLDVLHRDLKASNILCWDLDTGSNFQSRREMHCEVADYESSVGVVGTAFWRAPEILRQVIERTPKVHFRREADVYSFAMTCYEIFTGHIPFEGCNPNTFDDVLNGVRPTLPEHVPTWVKDLIHKCWHRDPLQRPTFSAILEEIQSRCNFDRRSLKYMFHNAVVLEGPGESQAPLVLEDAPIVSRPWGATCFETFYFPEFKGQGAHTCIGSELEPN